MSGVHANSGDDPWNNLRGPSESWNARVRVDRCASSRKDPSRIRMNVRDSLCNARGQELYLHVEGSHRKATSHKQVGKKLRKLGLGNCPGRHRGKNKPAPKQPPRYPAQPMSSRRRQDWRVTGKSQAPPSFWKVRGLPRIFPNFPGTSLSVDLRGDSSDFPARALDIPSRQPCLWGAWRPPITQCHLKSFLILARKPNTSFCQVGRFPKLGDGKAWLPLCEGWEG